MVNLQDRADAVLKQVWALTPDESFDLLADLITRTCNSSYMLDYIENWIKEHTKGE
jgi:hypothetical protein